MSEPDGFTQMCLEENATRISDLEAKLAEVSSNLDHAVHQIEMLNGRVGRMREALEEVRDSHWSVPLGIQTMHKVHAALAALTDTPPTD